MCLEFVVGSRLANGLSPDSPVSFPPEKSTSPNSNSTRIDGRHENRELELMCLPL